MCLEILNTFIIIIDSAQDSALCTFLIKKQKQRTLNLTVFSEHTLRGVMAFKI